MVSYLYTAAYPVLPSHINKVREKDSHVTWAPGNRQLLTTANLSFAKRETPGAPGIFDNAIMIPYCDTPYNTRGLEQVYLDDKSCRRYSS